MIQILINQLKVKCLYGFTCTSINFDLDGATSEMRPTVLLELVKQNYALSFLCDRTGVVFEINQAFCDPDLAQTQALFTTYQIRDFEILIDNCTQCHHRHDGTPGTQLMSNPKGDFEFHFDGKNSLSDI